MNVRRSRRGSILMEYMIIQVLVACLLILTLNYTFYNWASGEYVGTGLRIKYFYQRVLGGLSLPVP